MGALAIIRFRTSLKDPRDIVFMFASLASGIACGVDGYNIAVGGTAVFCLTALFLYWSPFGQTSHFDGMLRFNIENDPEGKTMIGLVAQDAEKVIPELTFTNPEDGYMGINYAEITAVLIEAVKEQQDIISELRKEMKQLRNDTKAILGKR